MRIGDIPRTWAHGNPVNVNDRLRIALLRQGGCTCEYPLIRSARNGGPLCKVCGVQVFLDEPTSGQAAQRRRDKHLADKRIVAVAAGTEPSEVLAGLADCYDGCGCETARAG
jgi:hypothetical protein